VLAVLVAKCVLVALKHNLAVTVLQVFVLVGPTGAGRTSLARLLLNDYPSKLAAVPLLTNRCVPQNSWSHSCRQQLLAA
jgi:ABC-type molybdenum transport system ATPase subunit/photorepair protein PhrA